MKKLTAWVGRMMFGTGIVIALGFGAQQAFSSSAVEDCQPCQSTPECCQCCVEEMGAEDGICFPPACFCIG